LPSSVRALIRCRSNVAKPARMVTSIFIRAAWVKKARFFREPRKLFLRGFFSTRSGLRSVCCAVPALLPMRGRENCKTPNVPLAAISPHGGIYRGNRTAENHPEVVSNGDLSKFAPSQRRSDAAPYPTGVIGTRLLQRPRADSAEALDSFS
jgi:hypothetical protein